MLERIACRNCGTKIVVYRHEGYRGNRGRCPKCSVDFPLE